MSIFDIYRESRNKQFEQADARKEQSAEYFENQFEYQKQVETNRMKENRMFMIVGVIVLIIVLYVIVNRKKKK